MGKGAYHGAQMLLKKLI